MNNICILVYSHSDCIDVWDLTCKLLLKYNINDIDIVWGIDKQKNFIFPENFKIKYYNSTYNYTSRILTILNQINYKYIIHIHEDWLPCNYIYKNNINKVIEIMDDFNIKYVRTYRCLGGRPTPQLEKINMCKKDVNNEYKLYYLPPNCQNLIALQPALWNYEFMKNTFSLIPNCSIQSTEAPNKAKQFWLANPEKIAYIGPTDLQIDQYILAITSFIYPHVHAICRGKWMPNPEVQTILKEYNINISNRGILRK